MPQAAREEGKEGCTSMALRQKQRRLLAGPASDTDSQNKTNGQIPFLEAINSGNEKRLSQDWEFAPSNATRMQGEVYHGERLKGRRP
eukprot:1228198-Rhodomonas_salina.1